MRGERRMRTWFKHRDRREVVAVATFALLALCALIGGASQQNALRLALLELAALPVLALVILRAWDHALWRRHQFGLGLAAATAALPLVQLIMLPPPLWTALPGREQAVLALDLAGIQAAWSPISLTPDLTWRAFLALLAPLAVFLGVLQFSRASRRGVAWLFALLAVAGIFWGGLQLVGGKAFYPWGNTDHGSLAGFFANRNHMATLLLMALPFCAALAAARRRDSKAGLWSLAFAGVLIILALAIIQSRAGVILAIPTIVLSGLVIWVGAGRGRPSRSLLALAAAVGVAITVIAFVGLGPIADRFESDRSQEGRISRWPTVAEAAQNYLPVGAGFGSFDRVYRSVEPVEEVDETYFNRAHNDYLETWLEGGWLSVGIVLAFFAWFGRRAWEVWRAPPGEEHDLQRAASVAILVVLAHSVVDYPLRTVAIACLLAACAALLDGVRRSGDERLPASRDRRALPR